MEPIESRRIVDTARYPLTALDSAGGQALVDRCRADLEQQALCILPGFLGQPALARMVREAEALIPQGHRYDQPRGSYEYDDGASHGEGHPRRALHDNRYRQVLNYQIPNDSLIRQLFLWPALTEFVRRALGLETLYTSACPHLALSLHVAREGDCNGWHFDPNDGVVTLMLQAPESGGAFEYAPNIRRDGEENYEAVGALFAKPETRARRPALTPGALSLFNGSRSIHRVTQVGPTSRPRIMAIFSYDERPDQVFSQGYIDLVRSFPQDAAAQA